MKKSLKSVFDICTCIVCSKERDEMRSAYNMRGFLIFLFFITIFLAVVAVVGSAEFNSIMLMSQ